MKHALLLAALLAAGCSSTPPQPIRIKAVYSTTGPQTPLDVPSWHGVQTLVDQVNKGGGINGRKIDLALLPIDSTPATAAKVVQDALAKDPGIEGFVGLSDTDLALAAVGAATPSGKPFVISGATSPLLPSAIWRPRVFLACFGDNAQAAAAAEWLIRTKGAKTAAIVFDKNKTYTSLLNQYFTSAFRHHGGRIVTRVAFKPGSFVPITHSVLNSDVVYLAAETADDAMPIVRTLRSMGYPGLIVGGDGFDAPWKWRKNPLAADLYFTTHAFPAISKGAAGSRDFKAFKAAYEKTFKGETPGPFAALGRDAALVLATAIAQSNGSDRKTVNALRHGRPVAGLTGQIAYHGSSRVPDKPVALIAAKNPDKPLVEITPGWVPTP